MILAKVTLLLTAALLLTLLLRRRSAALRHLVWTLGLGGALALTVLSAALPPLRVSLRTPALLQEQAPPQSASPAPDDAFRTVQSATLPTQGIAAVSEARRAVAAVSPRGVDAEALLPAIYLLGATLILGWYALGRAALGRLGRRSVTLGQPEWVRLRDEVARTMGVSRPPRLLTTAEVGSPLTWGIRRPVIALPLEARTWTEERRRVVLAHEMAHAARGDHLSRFIGVLVCAIYWFHPLAWVALRRQTVESERAADDHVLLRGTAGAEYAAHLLDIARRSRALRRTGLVAVGMARRSHLEGRLLALLDASLRRAAPAGRWTAAAWTGLAVLVFPMASLQVRFTSASATAAASSEPDVDLVRVAPSPTPVQRAERRAEAPAMRPAREDQDSVMERTLEAQEGGTLFLDLQTGAEVTVRGWDRASVRVRVRPGGEDRRDTRFEILRVPDGVEVDAEQLSRRGSYSTHHVIDVMVPARYNLRLRSSGGALTVRDVEGRFSGQTGGGPITLQGLRGEARLSTGGGEVQVRDSELRGTVHTGGGTVVLSNVRGGLRGTSGSGPVIYADAGDGHAGSLDGVDVTDARIHVGDHSEGAHLSITKAGGEIHLDHAPGGATVHTGGGDVEVGRGAGRVSATTGGGDVTVGPIAGSVHAGTGAGSVHVTIVRADGEEQSVEVSSGNGAIVIDWPADVPARFELETAYTQRFGRTRIISDFDLPQEETEEWSDREGTPRRYVRATGQIGQGGGTVRVKTVNGNITIRRSRPMPSETPRRSSP